jgi:hypothetical protein
MEHLHLVLQRFKEEGLKLRLKKFVFGLQEMEYLGYIGKSATASTFFVETEISLADTLKANCHISFGTWSDPTSSLASSFTAR